MHLPLTISLALVTLFASLVHSDDADSGRIINGQDVPEGKYPFMVSLQKTDTPCDISDGLGTHFCGGSVINDNTVLTAAHCCNFTNHAQMSVLVGLNHLDGIAACYKVAKIGIHPEWEGKYSPDVCIMKLHQPIDFKDQLIKIERVCLPSSHDEPEGMHCIIMGWGETHEGSYARHLQELKVKATLTGEWSRGRGHDMHYKIVFKESGGQSCFGDSGGPMICQVKGENGMTLLQFGICSFGHDLDIGKCKGVAAYANTARYIDWIKQEAEKE